MSRNVQFNRGFFRDILRSEGVSHLTRGGAEEVADVAISSAPVDSGAYQAGIKVEATVTQDRVAHLVVGTDSKTLLVEAKTGNLARALRTVQGR